MITILNFVLILVEVARLKQFLELKNNLLK